MDTTSRSSAGRLRALMRHELRGTGHSSGLAKVCWRTTMMAVRGRVAPLSVRPFGRLLFSYTLNELGDSIGIVALAVLVYDRTEAVAPTAAFFFAAKFLPALLAPVLTARLDQVAVRRSLPALYVGEALVFAALALIAHGDFLLGLVLVLGLLDGALALTGRALTRGAVAAILQPAGLLREGNALLNIGFAIATVGGSALGGLLISQIGISTALLVDAWSFLAIALLLAITRGLPAVKVAREPFRERLNAGLRFARTNGLVRLLLIGEALALIMFTLVIPIEVIYAKESLGTTSAGFGILLASWGAGIVVGSLIYLLVKQRSAFGLIVVSTAAVGLAYLGMASADTLFLACLASIVGGAGNGVQWISVLTALQEATPADYQARVVGLLESLGAAMPGVGYVLGGALVALGSPRTAYAFAGAGVLLLVLAALLLRSRLSAGARAQARFAANGTAGEIQLPEPTRGAATRQGT
ncbi:MAG TPA: MFS transporter [Solirubrobacteraceae bacterium]|nr:MFS transporter [Solirubrobacteraceae bacterium]